MRSGIRVSVIVGLTLAAGLQARAQTVQPQASAQQDAQGLRAIEAQVRNAQAKAEIDQIAEQRPSTAAACAAPSTPVTIRVDKFGALLGTFGTQEQPIYVHSERFRVEVTGEPAELSVTPLDSKGTRTDPRPLTPGKPVEFSRDDLVKLQNGGLVKLQVETVRPGGTEPAPIATIWVIPYSPWTVVVNESGLVDPRFKGSSSPAHLPCDPILVYAPADQGTSPTELTIAAPGPNAAPILLNPDKCTVFRWPGTDRNPAPVAVRQTACGEQFMKPFMTDGQAQMVIVKEGRGLAVVALTQQPTEAFRAAESVTEPVNGAPSVIFPILLDRTGVASWQYLNRRRPPQLSFTTDDAYLRFRNNITDRQFVVTFSGIPDTERAELVRQGVNVANCRDGKCQASVLVPSNGGAVLFPLVPLYKAFVKGGTGSLITFTVSFFDEDTTPTHSRGHFTLVGAHQFVEPASSTTWSAAAAGTYLRDPDTSGQPFTPKGHRSASLTFENPWERLNRSHVAGSVTLNLRQTLGTRADLDVELNARKGDFGSDASNVQASKYLANVYAVYPLTLTGGRYDLAAPTSGIAISESGEAISGSYLFPNNIGLSVGRIFKKEMQVGSFTLDEEQKVIGAGGTFLEKDHDATVIQIRDLFARDRFRLSLYGVIGDAERGEHYVTDSVAVPPTLALREYDVDYWTAGADMVLGVENVFFSGGLYYSQKSESRPVELPQRDEVSGTVGLLSVSYTNPDSKVVQGKQGIDWVLTGLIGAGGDYVGESQNFAPDVLFLSTFASTLKEPTLPIGRGLTNKWYFGGVWTTPQFGFIKSVASAIPFLANDINSSSLTFKLHHYRLRDAGDRASNLGTEGSVEFRIESPKGVRYQFTVAGFEPGKALDPPEGESVLIRKFQYAVRFGVTIRFE